MSQSNNRNQRNQRTSRNRRSKQNMAVSNSNIHLYSPLFAEMELIENESSDCDVPITFRHLSELVDKMLTAFKPYGKYAFQVYTEENNRIYKKVCFILAEFRLAMSNRHSTTAGHLRTFDDNCLFDNRNFTSVPYPLALYLNSIGRFTNNSIKYVPVPAITDNHIADACHSCMPYMFTDVLNQLANGVEIEKVPVTAQESLKSLPAIDWEKLKNDAGVETHIRLKPESVEFWLKPRPNNVPKDQPRDLNITTDDFCIFDTMNSYLESYSPKILTIYKNGDQGNVSQLVRFEECNRNSIRWYTMHGVPDDYKKLGLIFGFGHFEGDVQPSIAIGDPATAHTLGNDFLHDISLFKLIEPILYAKNQYFESYSDSE